MADVYNHNIQEQAKEEQVSNVQKQSVLTSSEQKKNKIPSIVLQLSVQEHSVPPSGVLEQSVLPSSVQEDSVLPPSVQKQSVLPSSVQEDIVLPSSVQKQSALPSSVQEQSILQPCVQEQSKLPSSVQEQSELPSSVQEQSKLPSSVQEQSVLPSSVQEQSILQPCVQGQVQNQNVQLLNVQPLRGQQSVQSVQSLHENEKLTILDDFNYSAYANVKRRYEKYSSNYEYVHGQIEDKCFVELGCNTDDTIIDLPAKKIDELMNEKITEIKFHKENKDDCEFFYEKVSENKSGKMWEMESEKIRGNESEKMRETESEKIRGNESEKMWEIESEKIQENESEKIWETESEKMTDIEAENAGPTTQNEKVNKAGECWTPAKCFQLNIRDTEGPGVGGTPNNIRLKIQGSIF